MRFLRRAAAAFSLGAATAWLAAPAPAQQSPIPLRVAGHFTANTKQVDGIERPVFTGLARETGINLSVTYNPMDQAGVQAADALRHLRSGAFDVMSVLIGQTARDEPFIDSLDLIGVSTTLDETQTAVEAGREALDRRLQERFNAKVLTLWPFGPRSEERRVGKSVDLGGRRIIKKQK